MEKTPTGGKNVEWKKCRKTSGEIRVRVQGHGHGQGHGRGRENGQISPVNYSRIYYRPIHRSKSH